MSFPRTKFLKLAATFFLLFTAGSFAQTNGILREVYYNIGGNAVANLTSASKFPASPDEEFIESAFEAPSNFADNYAQRMRALLIPPVTGSYVFWISSDDNSVLYLSTDEDPAHKVQIASVGTWTSAREWNNQASQKSVARTLT